MIHEMRIYHTAPGRMPVLLNRFQNITLDIWARFNIRQVGFWTVEIGNDNADLYYLLEWESMAERERIWSAFMSDPEWVSKKAETEKDGPILKGVTNFFLRPTAFSALR